MTDFPDNLFQQLYKRAPNDTDRDRLIAVKAGLGLSPRDEMWPVIMTLDHYAVTNQSARNAAIKEMRLVLDALKDIPEKAGPIASAEAQKAIAKLIGQASDKIAQASAEKSITTADRISKRRFIIAAIAGALVASAIAMAAAVAMYLVLNARGICAEEPAAARDGSLVCYVDRSSG